VVLQLDLAFDLALDGEVLAAAQLAFDHYRFADVHEVPLNPPGLGLLGNRRARLHI
jgi:hypothetical protein